MIILVISHLSLTAPVLPDQAPCPMSTTSSPEISWTETAPCMRNVQRCSKLLNETVGECVCTVENAGCNVCVMSSVTTESHAHTGLAYRLCNSSGLWEEPDVRECQSVTFRNVETTVSQHKVVFANVPVY